METQQQIPKEFRVDPTRGVAKVIGDEVRAHGVCRLAQRQIAFRAGINHTSVRWWLDQMLQHGLIHIEQKQSGGIPNAVTITSRTWLEALGR